MALHPDFPERAASNQSWDQPDPLGDIISALDYANGGVTIGDIAEVVAYDITSNDSKWSPGRRVGSELSMTLLGRLHDGRWFGLEAGNDFTGWGCMGDQADLYVSDSREDVILNGLTAEGRNALGVTA